MQVKKKICILLSLCLLVGILTGFADILSVSAAEKPAPTLTKKTLYVGYESYQIRMKNLAKDSKVTYASSNPKVVKAEGNVISPVAEGKADITVTVK